jgi:hypothetical protein
MKRFEIGFETVDRDSDEHLYFEVTAETSGDAEAAIKLAVSKGLQYVRDNIADFDNGGHDIAITGGAFEHELGTSFYSTVGFVNDIIEDLGFANRILFTDFAESEEGTMVQFDGAFDFEPFENLVKAYAKIIEPGEIDEMREQVFSLVLKFLRSQRKVIDVQVVDLFDGAEGPVPTDHIVLHDIITSNL